jgi:hypothetical protein
MMKEARKRAKLTWKLNGRRRGTGILLGLHLDDHRTIFDMFTHMREVDMVLSTPSRAKDHHQVSACSSFLVLFYVCIYLHGSIHSHPDGIRVQLVSILITGFNGENHTRGVEGCHDGLRGGCILITKYYSPVI